MISGIFRTEKIRNALEWRSDTKCRKKLEEVEIGMVIRKGGGVSVHYSLAGFGETWRAIETAFLKNQTKINREDKK